MQMYNAVPISLSTSSRGSLGKVDCKISISSGSNGHSTLGTSTVSSLSTTRGPFQSIPKSMASSYKEEVTSM